MKRTTTYQIEIIEDGNAREVTAIDAAGNRFAGCRDNSGLVPLSQLISDAQDAIFRVHTASR